MKLIIKSFVAAALLGAGAAAATLATVNGHTITSDEVETVLMEGTQGRFTSLPEERQAALRNRVIDGMIMQELIYEEAKRSGVLKSAEYKAEFDLIKERLEKQLAAKVWQKQLVDAIQVTDKEAKAYYDTHTDEFVEQEKVHARHILVKTEAEATAIIKQLKQLKGDALKNAFIEAAKAKSTGPSASKGGDLGFFAQGQMVPEFNDAAFGMAVGTMTDAPVKTQFGYHVIYVEAKSEAKKALFSEVKAMIEMRLKQEQFQKAMAVKMESLKGAAKISYAK